MTALTTPSLSQGELRTVCTVLFVETEQANASLPTPDTQTTNLLASAYTKLGDAAILCYSAVGSQERRHRAETDLTAGGALLAEASARVTAVTAK